ncbi:flippase-like domain-containing protein [Geoglobus acetivorans]|uniref:Flippase-like domain-containing protein n=1 Tax=Geoglobus acetivorans TaxID=565033 RepID=A0ABZ3H7C0_GEOAI|nr:flippase-like domain-containing protein [Geoglobus acetivorans]
MEGSEKNGTAKKLILAVTITVLSIAAITKIGNVSVEDFAGAKLSFIVIALILHAFFWIFWTIRLWVIVRVLEHKAKISSLFAGVLSSNFVAAITPSSAGGEPVRIKVLVDSGMSAGSATACIMVERFLDALFFSVFLLAMISISGFAVGLGLKVGIVFTALLILFFIFLYELFKSPERIGRLLGFLEKRFRGDLIERLEREIWSFRNAISEMLKNRRMAFVLFLLTGLVWLSEFLIPSVLLMAFSCEPHWILSLTSQAILVIVSLVPLTPGSSGIAEFGFFYLYSSFASCRIGAVAGLWRIITYVSNILAGLVSTVYYLKNKL